jgi:2-polyprenyl-3-methyl-5-hydroxy-6-metoxy-1,4-benzoquinol methylase
MNAAYAAAYPVLYRQHWWWRSRERMLEAVIENLLRGVPNARILDVGCGAGLFFDVLSRYGDVEGVESDRHAVEQSGRWRDRIHVGQLSSDGPAFDLILLLDVLEHVADPHDLLRTVVERLAPGGHVLVTVPAFQWLWTSHDVMNQHVRRYSRSGLKAELMAGGLTVVDARYLFQSMVGPKLGLAIFERLAPRPPRVPHIPGPFVNDALQAWIRIEHRALGWLPFGGSVMAVASAPTGR